MRCKKSVSLILAGLLIITACMPIFASAEDIPDVDNVPYVMSLSLYDSYAFTIDRMRDLPRLLSWMRYIKRNRFNLKIEDDTLREAVRAAVEDYIEEHQDEFVPEGPPVIPGFKPPVSEVKDASLPQQLSVFLNWRNGNTRDGFDYGVLPQISSDEDFYQELLKCRQDENYQNVLCLATDYFNVNSFNDSLNRIKNAVQEEYGMDIKEYTNTKYGERYLTVGAVGNKKLLLEINHSDIYEREEARRQERYNRILKNNTIIPISEDMTDEEKLAVLAHSTGNVLATYYITDLPNFRLPQKERVYSVGVGQCTHYAAILKELCDLYGIPCYFVGGNTNPPGAGHAWNIIKYNGNWYNLDTTGCKVCESSLGEENLSLNLYSDYERLDGRGYIVDKMYKDLPQCTAESVYIEALEDSIKPEITDNMEWVALFEPYTIRVPMTGPITIFCNILIDHSNGKIMGIDTNLGSDSSENVDGKWVAKKSRLDIPSEINGTRVTAIAPYVGWKRRDSGVDILSIPDGVVLEENAFGSTFFGSSFRVKDRLILGDNVTAELDSFPYTPTVAVGKNFTYKGENEKTMSISGIPQSYYSDLFSAFSIPYLEDEDITVEEGYRNVVYYAGNNIVDEEPVKTLTLSKDVSFVDPRLGRLNRNYLVPEENPNYTAVDGVLYNKSMTELISVPIGKSAVDIPDTVTHIGDFAFDRCNELESIEFPASVEEFGKRAFRHLSNLSRVVFEESVPQSFNPIVCSEFALYSNTQALKCEVLDTDLRVNNPGDGIVYTAFYDYSGRLIGVSLNETTAEIPAYATEARVHIWNDIQKPLYPMERVNLR